MSTYRGLQQQYSTNYKRIPTFEKRTKNNRKREKKNANRSKEATTEKRINCFNFKHKINMMPNKLSICLVV